MSLMSVLTLSAKFSNGLRDWEAIIPTDSSTTVVVQAHIFLVHSGLQLKKKANTPKPCFISL